ncbi:MAG: helix-turn-helix transcriptional regulator [Tissierellales bacterium]|nr:helix-turn-helix transcriptional regulator [Tissierellales bacterium]MBN2828585.1 helix-turn-helix transcriptional regulator [Tissierellales bacterium]
MNDIPYDILETAETLSLITDYCLFAVRNNGIVYLSGNKFKCMNCQELNSNCLEKWRDCGEISARIQAPYYFKCPLNYSFCVSSNIKEPEQGVILMGPFITSENKCHDDGKEDTAMVISSEKLTAWGDVIFALVNIRTKEELVLGRKKRILEMNLAEKLNIYRAGGQGSSNYHSLETKLIHSVASFDEKMATDLVSQYLSLIFIEEDNNIERIKKRMTQTIYLLSRNILSEYYDYLKIETINHRHLALLNTIYEREDVEMWFYQFVESLMNQLGASSMHRNNLTVYKIQKMILQRYMEDINLIKISDELNMNYHYLSSLFNQVMGMNFKDYIRKIRIEKSEEILKETDMSLTDVASLVGFSSQSYFTKSFKKETGITPLKFRRTSIKASKDYT